MKFNFPTYIPYFFFQIFLLQKKKEHSHESFFSRHTTTTSHLVLRSLWKSADGSSMDGKPAAKFKGIRY